MLSFLKPKLADVLSHWYAPVPNFNTSTQEFYAAVERELKERQVPGLEMSRVDFAEGGLLSAKRQYLRMTRHRLVFDVSAAPFGTSYFFSCRFAEIPAVVQFWQLLVVLVGLMMIAGLTFKLAGLFLGTFILLVGLGVLIYLLRNAVAMGLRDLDATLIKSPVIGPIYERFFRKETFFRQDTRLMYCHTVNEVVKAKVEETTGAKGIKLVRFNEHSPIFGELYKPTTVQLPKTPPTPDVPCPGSTSN
jgi:hypothetical protein